MGEQRRSPLRHPSFRALSGRPNFTVRCREFNKDSRSAERGLDGQASRPSTTLSLYTSIYLSIYPSLSLYIYICIHVYIYIYIERERERERCIYIHIYIYVWAGLAPVEGAHTVLDSRATTSQNCEAVPRRARVEGS